MAQSINDARCTRRITSQVRKIVLNIYKYLRYQDVQQSETDIELRTASVTGISVRSLHRIKQQHRVGVIKSPPSRTRISPVMGTVDDFDKDCIRREVLAFYERGEIPTVNALLKRVKKPPVRFSGAYSSLHKIVKQLGFRFKKVQSGRCILMERNDLVVARNKYLRLIAENRKSSSPRPEIYLDETWVNQNECWTMADGSVDPKLKTGKGARYIILHAGGEDGFVPGAFLFFRSSNGNKGDYHDSINHTCFQSWFQTQLLPNIPAHSLIVMDNASYHSQILNKAPASNSKKCEIIQWLTEHNIAHDPSHTKFELLSLVKSHKNKQVYEVDQIACDAGHEVLRLPLYHCQLNPIELIWAKVKTEVKKYDSNTNQTLKGVEEITKSAIDRVTSQDWKKCICHTRLVEDEYRRKDIALEHLTDNLVINTDDDSSESDNDE
ncbi:uncharacterized protein LOC121858120 [Homarus americanus]|nr:uncharacterized protein LOC121858120 [Homarus americanus]